MSKIKEIWCICHSHLDVGYTHPQPMLMELQGDYIEQAIALCQRTKEYPEESQFRWTCEATYPVEKWMEHAEPEKIQEFIELVGEGRISVAALPVHTTPGVNLKKMVGMVKHLDELREKLQAPITTAINHDINGQPWTLAGILLDSHVDFYMTGINIHFGGIPFQRPMAFWWKTPDGRKLLSYVGEHYSLFSQFLFTYENSTERMHEGVQEYVERLEKQNHPWDIALLTATNPPMYDNNCPDWDLPDLVRKYNEEGHEWKIRIVTPEMFRAYLMERAGEFPEYGGDWSDFWNFGAGSAAREGRVARLAERALENAGVLECLNGQSGSRVKAVREEAEKKCLLYDEHTWGASQAISDPHDYESQSQYIHKMKLAYEAADLSGYLLAGEIEKLAGNPYQANGMEGITVINPTGVTQKIALDIPVSWTKEERQLSGVRAKRYIPYIKTMEEKPYYADEKRMFAGYAEVPPFSYQVIPFEKLGQYRLPEEPEKITCQDGVLETPYYRVAYNECTGRILQIHSKTQGRDLIDETSPWGFFEVVRETIDPRFHKEERRTFFPRDVELANRNISVWNHEWKGRYEGADEILGFCCTVKDGKAELVIQSRIPGTKWVEQKITFYQDREEIGLDFKLHKLPVEKPESLYLAFPLKLSAGWNCMYNTAGQYVALDEETLGNMSRGWITVDNGVALFDQEICFGLEAFEAPLIQVGGFHFGRERREIPREENPLLLAWPLNNYWDTNFVAAQSDVMEFSYRFCCKERFDRAEMYREFQREAKNGLIGAAIRTEEKTVTLLNASEEGVVVNVYPAREEGAFMLLLKNQELEGKELTVKLPTLGRFTAVKTDMQEKERGDFAAEGEQVTIPLGAQELSLVKVKKA